MLFEDICLRHSSLGRLDKFYLIALLNLVVSLEIRDQSYEDQLIDIIDKNFKILLNQGDEEIELLIFTIWGAARLLPEIKDESLAKNVRADIVTEAIDSLANNGSKKSHLLNVYYKKWIQWVYQSRPDLRTSIRVNIGRTLAKLAHNFSKLAKVSFILDILHMIIKGMAPPLNMSSVQSLVYDVLIPLHVPNDMVEWRDQQPVLQTYHNSLVLCIIELVEKDRNSSVKSRSIQNLEFSYNFHVLSKIIHGILKVWPEKFGSNTPKEILLLHELEKLLELSSLEEFEFIFDSLFKRIERCLRQENFSTLVRHISKLLIFN